MPCPAPKTQRKMESIKFSVYAPKPKQVVIFEFYMSGYLKAIYFNDNAKGGFVSNSIVEAPVKIDYISGKIPPQFDGMKQVGCIVKDISVIDLSFEKFWNTYAYKRGNLARSKKLWAKLSEQERILALGFIAKLRVVYEQERKDMPYPETYLSQKRWENEL